MKKKENTLSEELKPAKNLINEMKKEIREKNKQLKMVEKGKLPIEEIKPFFENK